MIEEFKCSNIDCDSSVKLSGVFLASESKISLICEKCGCTLGTITSSQDQNDQIETL